MSELLSFLFGFLAGFVVSVLCCIAILKNRGYYDKETQNEG